MLLVNQPKQLENHGDRFVLHPIFLSERRKGSGFDVDKIYGKLEIKGFDD
jgi:hypothetical protein